jgi:hypothetical protein
VANTFHQQYESYMAMHQNEVNRWLHVIALFTMWGLALAALLTWDARYLVGVPGCYAFAFAGHFIFERNRPAFAHHLAQRGWKDVRGLFVLFVVEEVCVVRMAFEQIGLARRADISIASSAIRGEAR